MKDSAQGKREDKNGVILKDGDIIDIHQTVNGQKLFIVLDAENLDIRYHHDLDYKYQYDKESLLAPCRFGGHVEWEIVGNIFDETRIDAQPETKSNIEERAFSVFPKFVDGNYSVENQHKRAGFRIAHLQSHPTASPVTEDVRASAEKRAEEYAKSKSNADVFQEAHKKDFMAGFDFAQSQQTK